MIYQYRCPAGHEFEKSMTLDKVKSKVKCPKCKKMARKVITVPKIRFVGTGFYINDSKGK